MTGQPAYTDADVEAAKQPILDNFHPPSDRIGSWHIRPEEMARAILNAVAPAIAARAFAAGYIEGVAWDGWVPTDEEAATAAQAWIEGDE